MTRSSFERVPPWGARDDDRVRELRARASERATAIGARSAQPSARRIFSRPQLGVALGALAALVLVGATAVLTRGTDDDDVPSVSALASEPTPGSRAIAARIGGSGYAEEMGIEGSRLRETTRTAAGAVFVAPAGDDWLCVVHASTGGALGTSCAPRATLETEPITVHILESAGSERFLVAGITPDGYERAAFRGRSVEIETNGFVLAGLEGSGLVEVSGDGLPTLRVPVGIPAGPD